jgi:hypothetical protein
MISNNKETLTYKREVTPTTYLSKNHKKSFENVTMGSGQKMNKIITQTGTPLPFDQELSECEQTHKYLGKIKHSASWGNNLIDGYSQSINSNLK